MWNSLAAAQSSEFSEVLDLLTTTLTREQIAEAQRLAREWIPKPEG